MNDYEKVLRELSINQSLAVHSNKLSKIVADTKDSILKNGIMNRVIPNLNLAASRLPKGNKSAQTILINATAQEIQQLVKYARDKIVTKKPEWYDAAIKDGWTPPKGKYI